MLYITLALITFAFISTPFAYGMTFSYFQLKSHNAEETYLEDTLLAMMLALLVFVSGPIGFACLFYMLKFSIKHSYKNFKLKFK